MTKNIALIGASLGWGAQHLETELGPTALKNFHLTDHLEAVGLHTYWREEVQPEILASTAGNQPFSDRIPWIVDFNEKLAGVVASTLHDKEFPVVLGGDHAMAVGTWSGVICALKAEQHFGLLWVDAHMDAHTPETTPSQAVHGMPLASLLGEGFAGLVDLLSEGQKLNPKHVALLGVRSFEEGEAALLESLGVQVFSMADIHSRGLKKVFHEALAVVNQAPLGFGVTVDLDAFDPELVPGVGSPEESGIDPLAFYPLLKEAFALPDCKALEIAEYNPVLDQEWKTAKVIENLIKQLG